MIGWTTKAQELAAAHLADRAPGRLRRWRNRRQARRLEARLVEPTTRARPVARVGVALVDRPSRLRWIPPVAALGTAWVMQVIAVTDILGATLAKNLAKSPVPWMADHSWVGYGGALLLGVAVASCAEGGAAYLMDLYDKHLMARDSVATLRLAMFAYVGVSAVAIHWWAEYRELPPVLSWLLAGMSASALFLWSRGSRWRNRAAMREAGQLDPAMPRLMLAAKMMHPIRWVIAMSLASWTPAATTTEMRRRVDDWLVARDAKKAADKADRSVDRQRKGDRPVDTTTWWLLGPEVGDRTTLPIVPVDLRAIELVAPVADHRPDPTTRPLRRPTARDKSTGRDKAGSTDRGDRSTFTPLALKDAAMLRARYGDDQSTDRFPGRNELKRLHGGHAERWTKALRAHAAGADRKSTTPTTDPGRGDTEEGSPVRPDHTRTLIGVSS